MLSDADVEDKNSPSVRLLDLERNGSSSCGFELTRGRWDPYPWVSSVEAGSAASNSGMRIGDCVLEVNGEDIVGQRISEVAEIVKSKHDRVSLLLWNAGADPHCTPESLCCGPLPINLQRLSICMSSILAFLECPVCLDTIVPPTYQCDNGHLICIRCRAKSERCPVCRLRFNRGRSLLADQIYNSLIDAFNLREEPDESRTAKMQQIFKLKSKKLNVPDIKVTQSHTNKFLQKIVGKASSVDNLSSNSKFLTPINSVMAENEFNNTNLKTKSLSSNEIFQSDSSIVSRCGSMGRLSRNDRKKLLNLDLENRPASYHGSFENLNKNNVDLNIDSSLFNTCHFNEDSSSYYCPFSCDCSALIKGNNIMEHFQSRHDGPLVHYFKPNIKIDLKRILLDKLFCYLINYDENLFILRIDLSNDNKSNLNDVRIWIWFVGDIKKSQCYQMKVEIINEKSNSVLLSVQSGIFSLHSTSSQDIKENEKAVFFNLTTLEALNNSSPEIVFRVSIVKCNCLL